MFSLQKITHHRLNDGYSHFNYAILYCRGLNHAFNAMRYDSAFFARKSDVLSIVEQAKAGEVCLHHFSILLARYDWTGPRDAHWTHGHLCGDQRYEEIGEVSRLYNLNADLTVSKLPKKLKIKSELEYTGTVFQVLQVMLDNHATPADEGVAHRIEREFYTDDHQPITVNLVNYQLAEANWTLPRQ